MKKVTSFDDLANKKPDYEEVARLYGKVNPADMEVLKGVYNITDASEVPDLIRSGSMVRVGDIDDYNAAYAFTVGGRLNMSFEDFLDQLVLGYGCSVDCEIRRLFILSTGIWYDKDYC